VDATPTADGRPDRRGRAGRRTTGAIVIAVLVVVFVVVRLAHHTSSPVKLDGKVSNHGTRTVQSGATTRVLLQDTSYNPTFILVPPDGRITLTLQDQGFHAHTFTAPDLNLDLTLAPNTSQTVTVTLPRSGVVSFYCRFHVDKGMQGAFVVR
jgi:plastocyanin